MVRKNPAPNPDADETPHAEPDAPDDAQAPDADETPHAEPDAPDDAQAPAANGRPSLTEVADELNLNAVDIEQLYLAEVSAQADQCRTAPWSDWLSTALIRRVQVAVENGPRSGGNDPQVRHLEADHTKRVPAALAVPND